MRTMLLSVCFVLGAMAMNAIADEPKKDDPPKKKGVKEWPPLDEKATLRVWITDQKEFGNAEERDVKFKAETRKKTDRLYLGDVFYVGPPKTAGSLGKPTKGSEITDKDGKVWIVGDVAKPVTFKEPYICNVTPKPD